MRRTAKIRPARLAECGAIQALIDASSRALAAPHYAPEVVEAALRAVLGVDTRLIQDGTYFVATVEQAIVASGGWSRRKTLFGSDRVGGRDDELLDPRRDAAKIRAFFTHPDHTRQGLATRLLERCEEAAAAAGFRRLELGATLSGTAFYAAHGYAPGAPLDYECAPGLHMRIVPMSKTLRA
ncbi:MAG: GNAT family N-acetyltransferase [Xanthomonadales bacterium]|nr:GNAT family N-acetyltransferase [Xanthomonadales bacterium]NIN59765.1 GNAT family N-acetyltransferase [Xanthomonadales bacterium]NIN75140.1 GNAT family N-acetyltransferase [Xanthomonadales bacterium]NIO12726.1 GNAT family N-acetyltransferase [Xanthomonadales bacterium]NIP12158.1 GNAT family N-acetyltransferase [Xanthomonadales bacterium]